MRDKNRTNNNSQASFEDVGTTALVNSDFKEVDDGVAEEDRGKKARRFNGERLMFMSERIMLENAVQFHKLWHSDEAMEKMVSKADEFDYSEVDSLKKFTGTAPAVMQERINAINWSFDYDLSRKNFTLKTALLYWIEKLTGWRVGEYKNFKEIK